MAFWGFIPCLPKKNTCDSSQNRKEKRWAKLQWLSTAFLWVAGYYKILQILRSFYQEKLSLYEFIAAISIIAFAIGMIIISNGGTIQEVVSEKSDIAYSKAATLVDIAYALVLLYFKIK